MDQVSTAVEQPVDWPSPVKSLELPTGRYLAELSLSFDTKEGSKEYRLSIEAPTLKDVRGIYPAAFAKLLDTALLGQSNGGS